MLRGAAAFLLALSEAPSVSALNINSRRPAGHEMAPDPFSALQEAELQEAYISANLGKAEHYTFVEFVKDFQRTYSPGSEEWKMREEIFEATRKTIVDHHTGPAKLWTPGFNKFSDSTKEEYQRLMGYKPRAKPAGNFAKNPDALTDGSQPSEYTLDLSKALPDDTANEVKLKLSTSYTRNQGGCGSCWAVSATTVLEAHLELTPSAFSKLPSTSKFQDIALSSQELVSCVQNPHNCGGSGGCEGATSELAFELIKKTGISRGMNWMYSSGNGKNGECLAEKVAQPVVTISGFVKLPENKYKALMHALYQVGPVVLSVAANEWSSYSQGIFSLEKEDWTMNHAVAGIGYGKDGDDKYWLIKNSWGGDWGEGGKIRLLRTDDEESHCGWDVHPDQGTGCDGGPAKVWVCGHNGVLFDSSYPIGVDVV